MRMTPEMFTAICAGVTLLFYFTGCIVGAVVFVYRKIDKVRDEILKDVNTKHHENHLKYEALNELVIRHDVLLQPEFHANGGAWSHGR